MGGVAVSTGGAGTDGFLSAKVQLPSVLECHKKKSVVVHAAVAEIVPSFTDF